MWNATCRTRRAASARRRVHATGIASAVALSWLGGLRTADAATVPMSAIGNQAPLWMAVSPDYWNTHMVAALATAMGGCSRNCTHLWVTRNGGASWHDHPVPFDAAHLSVLTDGSGREYVVTESSAGVQRSDDDGATWRVLGPAGVPVADPSGAVLVAVPNGQDYIVDASGRHDVPGSAGSDVDLSFARAEFNGWLAATDRRTGNDVVMKCDMQLRCSGGSPLAGDHSADVTLLVANRERDVVARTTTGVYRSTDGGRSFAPLSLPVAPGSAYTTVAAVSLAPATDTEVVYVALLHLLHAGTGAAASTSGGVYATLNGGVTWRAIGKGGPLDGGSTAVASAPDGRLFAGYVNARGEAGLVCAGRDGVWMSSCGSNAASCSAPCSVAVVPGTTAEQSGSDSAQQQQGDSQVASGSAAADGSASSGRKLAATQGAQDDGPSPISLAVLILGVAMALVATPLSKLRRRRQ
jgi:hypothetical protein